jgi:hypothetical protein
MKLYTAIITPFMFGNWVLRTTNDINIDKGLNYIQIKEEPILKLKTLKQDGLFGIKKSRTAFINNINDLDNNTYAFTLKYSRKNTYSYSFLGIEIPEFRSNSIEYYREKNFKINFSDKTMLVTSNDSDSDIDNSFYYIFDLYIGKLKYPNAETSINTFIFTQIFGIILTLLISNIT